MALRHDVQSDVFRDVVHFPVKLIGLVLQMEVIERHTLGHHPKALGRVSDLHAS